MKDFRSSAKQRRLVTTLTAAFAAYVSSAAAVNAAPQSALDPYAAIQAPTAAQVAAAKAAKAKGGMKFGLPMLNKKQAAAKAPAAAPTELTDSNQTYVTTPGGKAKAVKTNAVANTNSSSTQVADSAVSGAPSEKSGGMLGGIKNITGNCHKSIKAATSGMVNGTKKMGSACASGAKASGSLVAKGAGAVGAGMKSTGEKMKDGTQATWGKISSIGKGSKQSPMQQATLAGAGKPAQNDLGSTTVSNNNSNGGQANTTVAEKAPTNETPVGVEVGSGNGGKFSQLTKKLWPLGKKQTQGIAGKGSGAL